MKSHDWYTLRYDDIKLFKIKSPEHRLPENLHGISVQFDADGNVLDIEADEHLPDGENKRLDTATFDPAALKALCLEALTFGDISP